MTSDNPLFIVLNKGSGQHNADATEAIIRSALERAGRHFDLAIADMPRQVPALAKRAVALAQQQQGTVVAAGGDGTINTVVQEVLNSGRPFGVLPQGTFNYFGRTHGIPTDAAQATQILLNATVQPVQVGLLNGRAFLVNASLGLYPALLEEREFYKQRFGRNRFVAVCSGIITLLQRHRQLVIDLEHEGHANTLRTPTLLVGNNLLQLKQIGIRQAYAVEQGQLVALALRPVGTLALLGLMCRGALGQLGAANNVMSFAFDHMTVRPRRRRRIKVAMDGEVSWMKTPLTFQVAPQPIALLVPLRMPADLPADVGEEVA